MNCHSELAAGLPRFEPSQRHRLVRRSRLGVSHPASKPASALDAWGSQRNGLVNRRSENLQHRGAHSKAHKTWGRSISSISVLPYGVGSLGARRGARTRLPRWARPSGLDVCRGRPCWQLTCALPRTWVIGPPRWLRFAARPPEGVRRADVRTRSVF
jgi:hypothetical protein